MSFDVCPECGFREDIKIRPLQNTMSHYVFESGKVAGIINSTQERITNKQGVVIIRKDVYDKEMLAKTPPVTKLDPIKSSPTDGVQTTKTEAK